MATEREGEEAPTRKAGKGREDDWKNFRKVRKTAVLSFFGTSSANSKHALEKATRPASTSTLRRGSWKGSETAARRRSKTRTASS